ncbi:MAG TPA: tail fiber protein [Allosphingosinicella sp.]|jgi:microcystin-dependent protein
MADPFVAEIRIFAFNFAPKGWAFCNGQIMPISQNTALFSLLGTFYGGDGKTNFALPNLQNSAPMHTGQGSGLSQRFLGQIGGSEYVTLLQSEMPVHTHAMLGRAAAGSTTDPQGAAPATMSFVAGSSFGQVRGYSTAVPADTAMNPTLAIAGGSLPHNNMQPYLALNFCIALQGVFPPRQ